MVVPAAKAKLTCASKAQDHHESFCRSNGQRMNYLQSFFLSFRYSLHKLPHENTR